MKEKEKKETKVNKEEKEKVSLFKKIFKKDSKKDIINSAKKEAHEKALKEEIIIKNDFQKDIQFDEDAYVSLRHIDKIYDNKVQAVFDFNLDIQKQEFIVLVGPSGCGKSTTLRMIAGLEEISNGELYIDHVLSNDLAPKNRNIAMVFQNYALYPHMTVYDNLAFGLKMTHVPKDEIVERVLNAAKILGLEELLDRKPKALSGGQRQRVALGRAIVRNAKVFLMDEPLSNLDAKLRVQMRSEIIQLHNKLKATTIYVTHDQTEAMTMASRIVVMSKGYIQQIGTPKEIYNHPANIFVASFIGSPAMNIFDCEYDNGKLHVSDDFIIELPSSFVEAHDLFIKDQIVTLETKKEQLSKEIDGYLKYQEQLANKEVKKVKSNILNNKDHYEYNKLELQSIENKLVKYYEYSKTNKHNIKLGIRPEDIVRLEDRTAKHNLGKSFISSVIVPELLGHEYYVHFNLGDHELISKIQGNDNIQIGDKLELAFNMDFLHLFDDVSTKLIK